MASQVRETEMCGIKELILANVRLPTALGSRLSTHIKVKTFMTSMIDIIIMIERDDTTEKE